MENVLVPGHPPADVFVTTTTSKLVPPNSDTITLNLGDYLQDLKGDLADVSVGPAHPKLTWSATELEVPTPIAITFVRVADLLITRSFAHAFPPDEGGRIDVSFTADHDAWRLTIEDNGMATPSFPDRRCDNLAIAWLLILKHRGCLEMSGVTGGTDCVVTIPKSDPEVATDVEAKLIPGSLKAVDWHRHES